MSKILVVACEGRHVPLHPSDRPHDSFELLGHSGVLKPHHGSIEVENTTGIRRRIRSGDLKIVKERVAPTPPPETVAPTAPAVPGLPPTEFPHMGTAEAITPPPATPAHAPDASSTK